jgi:hypothetical protein
MTMTETDWTRVKFFSPDEKWGDSGRMDEELIFILDRIRGLFMLPIVIHEGWAPRGTGGHVPGSYHYIGKAADFHIEGIRFRDAIDLMLHYVGPMPGGLGVSRQIGLGIYPHWATPGFHLDTRGSYARWGYVVRGGAKVEVEWGEAYGAAR